MNLIKVSALEREVSWEYSHFKIVLLQLFPWSVREWSVPCHLAPVAS